MTKFSELPFTGRLIDSHPTLAERQLGEVARSALHRANPFWRMPMKRTIREQTSIAEAFSGALGSFVNASEVSLIQIGAHDGISDDPLHDKLVESEWSAVLVEPTADAFAALRRLHGERPHTSLVNKAVTPNGDPLTLYTPQIEGFGNFGAVWTSTSREQVVREISRNLGKHLLKYTDIAEVQYDTISPASLLDNEGLAPTDINLLVCDIEGQDPPVIQAFLDKDVRPEVLLYEHLHAPVIEANRLASRLRDEGYSVQQSAKDTLAILD